MFELNLIFIRLFQKKYYLKNLLNGKMSVENVAKIFKTSNDNVEAAYSEYKASKNPFRKHRIKTPYQL